MNFEKIALSEVCDLIPGFAFKSKEFSETLGEKVIKIGDIVPPYVKVSTFVDCSKYDSQKLEKYKVHFGDCLLAMTGATIGKVGRFYGDEAFVNQRVLMIKPKEFVNANYIYALLCQSHFQSYIRNHIDSETAQPNISASSIGKYPINLPSNETQDWIGKIYELLTEKVRHNSLINDNLQQQATALFVKLFRSSSEIQRVPLSAVTLNITDGVHNTVNDDPDGECFLLSCKNIKGGVLTISTSERKINHETFCKLRKRTKLEKGDILLSSVGTIGELLLLKEDPRNYEFQRSVAIIKPNHSLISSEYLYEALLTQRTSIIHAAHGAVQQCLFISDIAEIEVPLPEKLNLVRYNNAVKPLFSMMQQNEDENKRLRALRDILLPKLMSGEIDVSDIYL